MQNLRRLGFSLLFAAVSLVLIMGGLSTSLAENGINKPPATITETRVPTRDTGASSTPGLLPSVTLIASPSATATFPPPTACPPPSGWVPYIVQIGDTLESLAIWHGITPNALKEANCLIADVLIPNTRIYVPPTPTATFIPCGPPLSWIFYTVQAGDNLYQISLKYRVTVAELQLANCMGSSTQIKVGQKLYVPNVPTSTPFFTETPTQTPSPSATSSTPSATSTTSTATETGIAPTETDTPTPTSSPTPSATATDTATPTDTDTPTPTETDTPTP